MIRKLLVYTFFLAALAVAFPCVAGSVKVSVQPGRGQNRISVGDTFHVIIQVNDVEGSMSKPGNQPGAQLLYFDEVSSSSSFTSINGHTTQSVSITYKATYRALKEGAYSFGPITVGGVKSNAAKYNIGKEMPSPTTSAAAPSAYGAQDDDDKPRSIGRGDDKLFMRANVSSTTVYEQQALVYTVKLYSTYEAIKFIGATASPKFDGFVVEESKDVSNSLTFETYQGKTYATAVIARYIIFPQMTGHLKVSGNTYTIAVDRREYYQDRMGIMSFATPLQLNVTPNDLTIDVRPLPAPKPADFSGAVGQFKLTSSLKGSTFKTNQAASILYTLSGTGNIKYAQLPELSTIYPPQLEVYTPTSKQDVKVGSSAVSGKVEFDYSFMPLEEGDFRIPPVKFVYFNPETGKYESTEARGYSITVGKGKEVSASTRRRAHFDSGLQRLGALLRDQSADVLSFAYWLWYIIPSLLLAIAAALYSRHQSLHSDMVALKSRRADKLARRQLKKAAKALRRNDAEGFWTELLSALWGYLAHKLKMPTSALLRDNVRQVLAEKGVEGEAVNEFIAAIDQAEFAKYAPSNAGVTLQQAYDNAARTIQNLEYAFKR